MWTRFLITVLSASWLLSNHVAAGSTCYCPQDLILTTLSGDRSLPLFEPESEQGSNYTSFRGLKLGMREQEAQEVVQRLGFALVALPGSRRAMHICMGQTQVGTVRFDQHGRIFKVELSPQFFAISKVVLREFADSIFEHYKVRLTSLADDVCYHDVTCFRGTTLSEQVLILRIAGDVQFHIGYRRSSLTQN
jgi:hypothetical protein